MMRKDFCEFPISPNAVNFLGFCFACALTLRFNESILTEERNALKRYKNSLRINTDTILL